MADILKNRNKKGKSYQGVGGSNGMNLGVLFYKKVEGSYKHSLFDVQIEQGYLVHNNINLAYIIKIVHINIFAQIFSIMCGFFLSFYNLNTVDIRHS
jgi:hypothetical protein